jgi:hypothetical protein
MRTTGAPFLGQVRLVSRQSLGAAVKCWKTMDGGTLCSDLQFYSAGCPTAPAVTEIVTVPTPPEASGAS